LLDEIHIINRIRAQASAAAVERPRATRHYFMIDAGVAPRPVFIVSSIEHHAASYEDYSVNWSDFSFSFADEDFR
jgi:hypothetical protein